MDNRQAAVYQALTSVYGTSDYAKGVNAWLAPRVLEVADRVVQRADKVANVRNLIWMSWPGGGTATIAAEKVLAALLQEDADADDQDEGGS